MTSNIAGADEDHRLAVAINQGNQQALSMLYDKYAPALMGIIRRIVHTDSMAEEILQTTFLHIWSQIGSFNASERSFFAWLLHIARNKALNKASIEQLKNPRGNNTVYEHADNNNEEQSFLEPVQKHIFDLVYYKGLSCAEAAAALKIPVEELRKNIRLAIKNMNGQKIL